MPRSAYEKINKMMADRMIELFMAGQCDMLKG
jgi:hypothetical protein